MADTSGLDPIVKEARERFDVWSDRTAVARRRALDDLRFAEADSENMWAWPNEVLVPRSLQDRPTLTINKARQHNLKIINDAKQNKPGVIIKGTGGGATFDSAQIYMGVVRYIEYRSNATSAYDTATEFQVKAGWGWWRVITDYVNENSFDQEILIRRIPDMFSCALDPDSQEADKSDARWGFVFRNIPRDQFEAEYPDLAKEISGVATFDESGWFTAHQARVADYYRIVETKDRLWLDGKSGRTVLQSDLTNSGNQQLLEDIKNDPNSRYRDVKRKTLEIHKIAGSKILSSTTWPGTIIPLIQIVGEEYEIEGQYDCKGHTRAMKDAQRMYNYWTSAAVEFVALQDKTPWVASKEAIENFQQYWNTANRENYSVLPYNAFLDGNPERPIPPPQRPPPPVMADAYIKGMQIALSEIMAVSGQYESQMGEPGNERTGRAIRARQRQGDNATYHFIDNLGVGIRKTGKIILEVFPKIYDTKRVLQIIAADGTTQEVTVDPQAQQANAVSTAQMVQGAKQIFNPNVGQYWVEADVGPNFATKREQAFDALVLLLTQSKELVPLIGDIMIRMGDFPMADEAAERLRRMVPPQALGVGPTQQEQQLMQQLAQLKGLLSDALDENAQQKLQLKGKDSKRDIDEYKAQTDRLAVLAKALTEDNQFRVLVAQLLHEIQTNTMDGEPVSGQGEPSQRKVRENAAQPPLPGAMLAPDGKWYMQHGDGSHSMVVPNGGNPNG